MVEAAEVRQKSRRPEDTPFKQQTVPSWQPIFTPMWVISAFFVLGIVFLPIGIALYMQSQQVVEMGMQYDGVYPGPGRGSVGATLTQLPGSSCSLPTKEDGDTFNLNEHGCVVSFTLQQDMSAPILIFYELDNYNQNFKNYANSKSNGQLLGQDDPSLEDCRAFDDVFNATKFNTTEEPRSYRLNPCGFIANTLFNDIFWMHSITTPEGIYLNQTEQYNGIDVLNLMDQSNIAWKSDLENKFKNYEILDQDDMYLWENPRYARLIPSYVGQPPSINETAWTLPAERYGVETERFVVWMRQAGLPYFRKPYGRIYTDLKKGTTIRFLISSNFPVSHLSGRKSIVISTTTWLGGRNPSLGILYSICGGVCLLLSFLFFGKHKLSPRQLGDANYLMWQGRNY